LRRWILQSEISTQFIFESLTPFGAGRYSYDESRPDFSGRDYLQRHFQLCLFVYLSGDLLQRPFLRFGLGLGTWIWDWVWVWVWGHSSGAWIINITAHR